MSGVPKDDRSKVEFRPVVASKLDEAAACLREAAGKLNEKGIPCGHCGLTKYESFAEHQIAKELKAAAEKLERYARRFGVKGGA